MKIMNSMLVVASALALGATGCKHADKTDDMKTTSTTSSDPDVSVITITGVDIDSKLATLCGLPDNKIFFKFDSAKLEGESKERLRQIADCATTGAVKGKNIIVVGHTDPVGTDEYNKQLGMSRADSVASYLKAQGLTGTTIETRSRGEAGAAADASGWPYDRRVSLRVQD